MRLAAYFVAAFGGSLGAIHGACLMLERVLRRRESVEPGYRDQSTGRPTGGGTAGGQPVDKWGKRGAYLRAYRAGLAGGARISTAYPHEATLVNVRAATDTGTLSTYPPPLLPPLESRETRGGRP